MSLEEKLEEANTIYREIESLLYAMPLDDSQPIEDELDLQEICDELEETRDKIRELSNKIDRLHRRLDKSHRNMFERLPVQRLLVRDRSYVPVLAPLMDMIPEVEDHPDIVWIRKWIKNPENSLEEATYFCIHAVRAAAEALVILFHVLKDQWERIGWEVIPLFEALFERCEENLDGGIEFGFVSDRFNAWIICVIGDSEMCPNSNLRLKMLLLYKLLKINVDNYEEALKSVFLAFSSLNRHQESVVDVSTKDITKCLNLFDLSEDRNMLHFGNQLADKLKHHRNTRKNILIQDISYEYAMGLKTLVEPREIIGLTAYLKYISYRTDIQYKAFQEDPNDVAHTEQIYESISSLDYIICNFRDALEQPEMLNGIAECFMNISENAFRIKYKQIQDGNEDIDDAINWRIDNLPDLVGREIIRRYKERICRWRLEIPREFMEEAANSSLNAIVYNDQY